MAAPDAWGLQYEEVMSLCWLAYKGQGTAGKWTFSNGTSWNLTTIFESGSFRAVLVEGPKRVLSFSGTDDLGDWIDNVGQGVTGLSGQYLRAVQTARSTAPEIIVGHSLGGGLASYCALYNGNLAATINPAPLNINLISGIAMLRNGGNIINYVAPGEVLAILDAAMINMRKVGKTHNVGTNGGWNPVARHGIDNLVGFTAPTKS